MRAESVISNKVLTGREGDSQPAAGMDRLPVAAVCFQVRTVE